jgi:hypothetical protein
MTRHLLLVHAEPVAGQDEQFNDWYDTVHLPDVLDVPGFVAAQRFIASPSVHGELPERRYLAIYEIDTDDLPGALAALSAATKNMQFGTAFDRDAQNTYAFTALGDRQAASTGPDGPH